MTKWEKARFVVSSPVWIFLLVLAGFLTWVTKGSLPDRDEG